MKFTFKKILSGTSCKALLLSTLLYLVFFHSIVFDHHTVFWGSDMKHKFFPVRNYLFNEVVHNNRFPFWTEKIYSGFPIYADIENAYLHPINFISTIFLGPILSYKVIHFFSYMLGSYGLFRFLRKMNIGYLGFIAANTIFFFSYYFINKQIHQSLILTIYTFPLSVYLLSQYMDTHMKKYISWSVTLLVSAFYWGHPQIFLIYSLGLVIYAVSFYPGISKLKEIFKYFFVVFWFVFLSSLPQLLPTLKLNSLSMRAFRTENVSAAQGAYNPLMFSMLFYPKIFLDSENYQGEDVNPDYSFVETYSYVGITTFVLFFMFLARPKDTRLTLFILLTYLAYIMFSFSTYIGCINIDKIPIISSFRYWTRSSILFIFAISLSVGAYIDKLYKNDFFDVKINLKNLLYIPISLLILFLLSINNNTTGEILKRFYTYIPVSYELKEYIIILFVFTFLLSLLLIFKRNLKISKILAFIFTIMVIFDLRYFASELIAIRTDDIEDLSNKVETDLIKNERVIILNDDIEIENNEGLYYNFWWPYGYSQFRDKKYYTNWMAQGLSDISKPEEDDLHSSNNKFYKSLGINAIILEDTTKVLNDRDIDIVRQSIAGSYIEKSEGRISFNVDLKKSTVLDTYVKSFSGWVVTIDDSRIVHDDSSLFIKIPVQEGKHTVTMKYIPYDFIYGVLLSVFGFIMSFLLYKLVLIKKRLSIK